MKHTPGPWKTRAISLGKHEIWDSKEGTWIATTHRWDQMQKGEVEANTRLIKVAPKMIDVLTFMERCSHGRPAYLCPKCVGKLAAKVSAVIDMATEGDI